jgi:hypothetical protein
VIDPRTLAALDAARRTSGHEASLVLEWNVELETEAFAGLGRAERSRALIDVLGRAKGPLLERLRAVPGLAVRDLPGVPQAIVTGSVDALSSVLGPGSALDQEAGVRVLPNPNFYTT